MLQLPLKVPGDKEEKQEVTVNLVSAKENSVDAAVTAVFFGNGRRFPLVQRETLHGM